MATATILPPAETLDLSESLYEVVDGVILEKPTMGAYENSLASLLGLQLAQFLDPIRFGRAWVEMVFDFRPVFDRQRRPDVAFISSERWPVDRPVPQTAAWKIVPELAIEIVSPTNPAGEMDAKVEEYFFVGVSKVWVVYPKTRRIYVYDSPTSVRIVTRGETLADDALLPGFRLNLDEFFGPVE
jgi:Uma2 family endonuclease